jgi:RecJ-like exonuclease
MTACSKKHGGEGGGHDIAAGARVPKEKKDEFLASVNNMFAEQIK